LAWVSSRHDQNIHTRTSVWLVQDGFLQSCKHNAILISLPLFFFSLFALEGISAIDVVLACAP
jgi:hypothetical protein